MSPVRLDCDALIAGAGPAGAATALRLARAGLSVVVVDRATFPREKACAEYMSPEGVRHLAALGVLDRIEAEGGRAIRGTRVVGPHGAALTGLFALAGRPPFRATGLSIPRRILDAALVSAAREAGATMLESTAVEGVVAEGPVLRGLRVRDRSGTVRELRARLTIGADGLHSRLAGWFGGTRHGPLRRFAFIAHVAGVERLGDTAEMHVGTEGYAGLNPLGGGIANVALVVPADRAAAARGRIDAFFFEQLDRFPGVQGRVHRGELVRNVMATGPFASSARRVIMPGGLLVGDAADFFDPFTGEGICAALRGAEMVELAVAGALARPGEVPMTALREYRRARRRAFLGKWVVERAIGYAMLAPAFFDRAVERLERHGLAHTLIGVTGDFVPARAVLNPRFLSRVML